MQDIDRGIYVREGEDAGRIEDQELARIAAEAEDPIRTAIANYRVILASPVEGEKVEVRTSTGKVGLSEAKEEDIASPVGERAISTYWDAIRNIPQVNGLRSYAAEHFKLSNANRTKFGREPVEKDESLQRLENFMQRLAFINFEHDLMDPNVSFRDKMRRIGMMSTGLNQGIEKSMERDINRILGDVDMTDQDRRMRAIYETQGYFAGNLMGGDSNQALTALEKLASLTSRDPLDVIADYMPLLLEVRNLPGVNEQVRSVVGGVRSPKTLDLALEKWGYLWVAESNMYVYMEGGK